MKLACITFTESGWRRMESIVPELKDWEVDLQRGFGEKKVALADWTRDAFESADALLFVGATGIAVRAIAPFVQNKTEDPAVVVMDEKGQWVIPLLSGHIGGANRLAKQIARISGGAPVLTTATDVQGLWAVDEWATREGLVISNPSAIKTVSALLLQGKEIALYSDIALEGSLPRQVVTTSDKGQAQVIISPFNQENIISAEVLHLVPRCICAGIGCRKGALKEHLEEAFQSALQTAQVTQEAIASVHSIDLKEDEPGLQDFCMDHDFNLVVHTAAALEEVSGSVARSAFVKRITGVDNVCERSALVNADELLLEKQTGNGVTIALAVKKSPYDLKDEK